MQAVRRAVALIVVAASGCLHPVPRDFLPRTGIYVREEQLSNPLGESTAKREARVQVVQDQEAGKAVLLDVTSAEDLLIAELGVNQTTKACSDALAGGRLGMEMKIDPATGDLFVAGSSTPSLPNRLEVGYQWGRTVNGNCEHWQTVVAMAPDLVRVRTTSRCDGRETEFFEEWKKGMGRSYVGRPTGSSMTFRYDVDASK